MQLHTQALNTGEQKLQVEEGWAQAGDEAGDEAGRRLGAGWAQAGDEARRRLGTRLGAGWAQAGCRLGAGWGRGLSTCMIVNHTCLYTHTVDCANPKYRSNSYTHTVVSC